MKFPEIKGIYFLVAALSILCSCAPSRFVKPLKKGQTAVNAYFGGPLIKFSGATIPMPLTAIGAGHGFTDQLTAYGNLHTTALAFGVLQVDAGAVYEAAKQKGAIPGISINPAINLAIDKWEENFKFWPQLDVNAYWNYGKKDNYFYVGISNWVELANKRAHNEIQPEHWIFMPQIGHTFVGQKWDYQLEVKYIDPFKNNKNIVVEYSGLGNNGALAAYFGIVRKF